MRMTAGIVGPAHGLRGEAIIDVRTDDLSVFAPGSLLEVDGDEGAELTVRASRTHKGRLLVSFEELRSREDAEALRGRALLVEERAEEDAWYPHELVGFSAVTPTDDELGTVSGFRFGAAQDLLLVTTPRGEVMVPFVKALVPEVDVEGRTVLIDPPPGLFDDDAVDAGDQDAR